MENILNNCCLHYMAGNWHKYGSRHRKLAIVAGHDIHRTVSDDVT